MKHTRTIIVQIEADTTKHLSAATAMTSLVLASGEQFFSTTHPDGLARISGGYIESSGATQDEHDAFLLLIQLAALAFARLPVLDGDGERIPTKEEQQAAASAAADLLAKLKT